MQISVTITADPDDDLPEPTEIARLVLGALGGDEEADHVSVSVATTPSTGEAGTPRGAPTVLLPSPEEPGVG
jgi:hypothetical protein